MYNFFVYKQAFKITTLERKIVGHHEDTIIRDDLLTINLYMQFKCHLIYSKQEYTLFFFGLESNIINCSLFDDMEFLQEN